MPDPEFSVEQIGAIVRNLRQEREPHNARLRVRRMLVEMAQDAKTASATGTYLAPPFDKSKLIIKTLIGDVVDTLQHYTSRMAANPPVVSVLPVAIGRENVTKAAEQHAAEEERLLGGLWHAARGRQAQWKASWSKAWGRVGWYLTLPREASWGLPQREYFDDLTDDEIEELKRAGKVTEVNGRKAESAGSWMDRRRATAQGNAIAGRSLFTLEEFPPDMVYPRFDADGSKYLAIIADVPATDFAPGSDAARDAAKRAGITDEQDIDRYGLYMGPDGKIAGGVSVGGEPGSQRRSGFWQLTRFITRYEIYYLVSPLANEAAGTIVWHDRHDAGVVPCVPSPAIVTDSGRPGAEYSSPMEAVFAIAPIINQIETLLSNVAVWNALPRFIVETADGRPVRDPETGEPKILMGEPGIGFDPKEIEAVGGKVRQLVIDADLLLKLLEFYAVQLDEAKPSPASTGSSGTSGAAWTLRQIIMQSQQTLQQPVDNDADAWLQIMKIWIGWLRKLDEPVFMFAAPGKRRDDQTRRGLLEFDPANLVESIKVVEDSNTASDRVVLQQAGLELRAAGVITDREYFETYALEEDPEEAELLMHVQQVKRLVMMGDTSQIQPGSVLFNVAHAVQGRVYFQLLEQVPNMALAEAERMSEVAQAAAAVEEGAPEGEAGGNVAEAMGIRQQGIGMGLDQPGEPAGALPSVAPAAPGVGR